jgi:beta-catenin-like protein 1
VAAETKRLDSQQFDDVEMDDEDKYLAKMEAGLYTLQLLALIMAHIWSAE